LGIHARTPFSTKHTPRLLLTAHMITSQNSRCNATLKLASFPVTMACARSFGVLSVAVVAVASVAVVAVASVAVVAVASVAVVAVASVAVVAVASVAAVAVASVAAVAVAAA
jgi:hypothetical protein